jgi:hypothetical protein
LPAPAGGWSGPVEFGVSQSPSLSEFHPPLELRLGNRWETLVESHLNVAQSVAAGIHAVPDAGSALAATRGASRFLNNERVSLPSLAAPLLEFARREIPQTCDSYVLCVHDWSQLMYPNHTGKKDRIKLSSRQRPEGYELQTALLVSDRDGVPIAPASISLKAADGVHCSRYRDVRPAASPLDELDPAMTYVERQKFGRPIVHIADAETDSVFHYRQWSTRSGRLFLIRADNRIVTHEGSEKRCSAILASFREQGGLRFTRDVFYHGRKAKQYVAETTVWLTRAAQRNRTVSKDQTRHPGQALQLRLIISEVRDLDGTVLAVWYLLSNVPETVQATTLVLWYYWRWSIESFFKLMKSAGHQVEQWQQEAAAALTRRLLVAAMACVVVWRLDRSTHPEADRARRLLVKLSGRLMKHGVTHTKPAMLAGLWVFLAMLHTLEEYDVEELRALADVIFNLAARPPP